MLMQNSCQDFLTKLASKQAVPGGGGAAALAGSLGAALASMVCNLTIGKKKYQDVQEDIALLLTQTEALRSKLAFLAEEDARVFEDFMQVYKLPNETDEQKKLRADLFSARAIAAADVPWQIAELCREVLKLCVQIAQIGNKQVISDAAVAALLARAALRSACYNVLVNMPNITDAEYVKKHTVAIDNIKQDAFLLEEQVLEYTEKVLLGE